MITIYLSQVLLYAFITTTISIMILKLIAPKFGLLDISNHRKDHVGEPPLIGGIAMFIGILFSVFFLLPNTLISMTWLFASAGIVVLGVWDDAKGLPVNFRLIIQALMTLILSLGSGYYLHDFGDIFGFGGVDLGNLGYVVTAFAVIGAINAFNMIDGIDGLAGMMALVSFSALTVLFWNSSDAYGFYVSCISFIVIIPYLANNLMLLPFKHKIFMGDAGSMLIGFSIVWLLIYGSQATPSGSEISFRPITALYIIAIPLMDMVAILIRRIRKGKSPFMADRDHIHHVLMRAGFSSKRTLMIISFGAFFVALVGVLGDLFLLPESLMLVVFVLLFGLYNYLIRRTWKFVSQNKNINLQNETSA